MKKNKKYKKRKKYEKMKEVMVKAAAVTAAQEIVKAVLSAGKNLVLCLLTLFGSASSTTYEPADQTVYEQSVQVDNVGQMVVIQH